MANSNFDLRSGGWRALVGLPECAISSSFCFILIVTMVRLAKPGGLRSVIAESVLVGPKYSCGAGHRTSTSLQAFAGSGSFGPSRQLVASVACCLCLDDCVPD